MQCGPMQTAVLLFQPCYYMHNNDDTYVYALIIKIDRLELLVKIN